jgi:hypothetical protein
MTTDAIGSAGAHSETELAGLCLLQRSWLAAGHLGEGLFPWADDQCRDPVG